MYEEEPQCMHVDATLRNYSSYILILHDSKQSESDYANEIVPHCAATPDATVAASLGKFVTEYRRQQTSGSSITGSNVNTFGKYVCIITTIIT